jgi:glycerol-3-phosphate responsive antiterminator
MISGIRLTAIFGACQALLLQGMFAPVSWLLVTTRAAPIVTYCKAGLISEQEDMIQICRAGVASVAGFDV